MKRVEENEILISEMTKMAKNNSIGTCEEGRIVFQLGVIGAMLADISKSLAILADKAESEE